MCELEETANALQKIQEELKVPKSQFNKFGGYSYRSCEDILETVKPLLAKYGAMLTLTDTIVEVGGLVYVKADAIFRAGAFGVEVSAYAREPETKKGMDASQITGAASSYARKYALNGLFLIDDAKDADATNQHEEEGKKKEQKPTQKPPLPDFIPLENVITEMEGAMDLGDLGAIYKNRYPMAREHFNKKEMTQFNAKKDELKKKFEGAA
jgi:hypothetical protein